MSLMDIFVLTLTILLVLAIVFFSFAYPKIKRINPTCASCPAIKKTKRALKKYIKSKK